MKKMTLHALALMAIVLTTNVLAQGVIHADYSDRTTHANGTNWQLGPGKGALAKINSAWKLNTLKKGETELPKLFAEVKADGMDPIKATQISALSNYVMTVFGKQYRTMYAAELFKAATGAKSEYATVFFLEQLRWCGLASQGAAILKLGETRGGEIKKLAQVTNYAVVGDIKSKYAVIKEKVPMVTDAEKADGFVSIFNSKDLTGWKCSIEGGYAVDEDGILFCCAERDGSPAGGGNLVTEKQYTNFILRFDLRLPPNANNGLGIRYPGTGDAAYNSMELQILDDTSATYAEGQAYQYHGSIYGVAPAKRGALKPVGQWNSQEVRAEGSRITVIVNGITTLDVDTKKLKPLDGKDHPGLNLPKGYITWCGHGSRVEWRNIRIKELK